MTDWPSAISEHWSACVYVQVSQLGDFSEDSHCLVEPVHVTCWTSVIFVRKAVKKKKNSVCLCGGVWQDLQGYIAF